MADESGRLLDGYLVASAQAGNRKAFAALFERWRGALLRHAWHLLGDAELAKDCAQDAWTDIVRGLPRLRDGAAFQAWALRIVTRRCARTIRGRQRLRQAQATAEAELDETRTPADAADNAVDGAAARRAVATLPADQRVAVELFYLNELSVAEIAVALDTPVGTIKTRLMHARRNLLKALTETDHD
jgi:RNA polymerase sigma-70 factor (ECF subfamily)